MASIKGLELKAIKRGVGEDGPKISANMYLNGKKIGTFLNDGTGSLGFATYVSKEAEENMMRIVIDYAKELNGRGYFIDHLRENPDYYNEVCEIFKKQYPYIADADITMETMANNNVTEIVYDLLGLIADEKEFREVKRRGYKAIAVFGGGNKIRRYPNTWTDEQIIEDAKNKILYMSYNDFVK